MILTKSTFSKKMRKNVDFGVVFGSQNDEKSRKNRLEHHVFFNIDFLAFFCDFFGFWLDFGRPGAVKQSKKNENIDFLTRSVLKEASGRVLGGFWEGFGRVLGGFGGSKIAVFLDCVF